MKLDIMNIFQELHVLNIIEASLILGILAI